MKHCVSRLPEPETLFATNDARVRKVRWVLTADVAKLLNRFEKYLSSEESQDLRRVRLSKNSAISYRDLMRSMFTYAGVESARAAVAWFTQDGGRHLVAFRKQYLRGHASASFRNTMFAAMHFLRFLRASCDLELTDAQLERLENRLAEQANEARKAMKLEGSTGRRARDLAAEDRILTVDTLMQVLQHCQEQFDVVRAAIDSGDVQPDAKVVSKIASRYFVAMLMIQFPPPRSGSISEVTINDAAFIAQQEGYMLRLYQKNATQEGPTDVPVYMVPEASERLQWWINTGRPLVMKSVKPASLTTSKGIVLNNTDLLFITATGQPIDVTGVQN